MFTSLFLRAIAAIAFLAVALPAFGQPAVAGAMRAAGEALIASVDPDKRAKLVLPFADGKRTDWHYTPRSRPGLSFADLNGAQRDAVHKLLRTALSAAGHRRLVNIVELELVLREIETFGLFRDPGKYFLVFFGAPHATNPWSWRFEGHHLSLSFTLRGDAAVAATPSFMGANPAEVPKGPKRGLRTLAEEEDEGRKLLGMLDAAQRAAAVIDARTYGDIVTRAADRVAPLENRGIEARRLSAAQKAQLEKLIEVYAASFEPDLRQARRARAADGFDAIRFAWAGATERGQPHYYRVQGPKFLIEYDASQDDGNHIHTVWRDFTGDFGRDLLRDHYSMTRGTAHRHQRDERVPRAARRGRRCPRGDRSRSPAPSSALPRRQVAVGRDHEANARLLRRGRRDRERRPRDRLLRSRRGVLAASPHECGRRDERRGGGEAPHQSIVMPSSAITFFTAGRASTRSASAL